jgi:hypothetical protein
MFQRYFLAPLAALLLLATIPHLTHAQTGAVGIGTTAPDASAALDIVSSSKGVLLPRVANASSITNPAPGLLVYQTGGTAGFYYNAGTAAAPSWQRLSPGDNLGNHTATQALNLNGQKLTGGGANGLRVRPGGGVRIDTLAGTGAGRLLTVAPDGTLQASAPIQGQALASTAPAPQLVGSTAASSRARTVGVNAAGTRAYAVVNGGLQAYDISGSGAPVAVGSPATIGSPSGFYVVVNAMGTRACVLSTDNSTLQAFDVSGGSTPVALGSPVATGVGPNDLALNEAGTRAYVVAGGSSGVNGSTLEVYDISGSGAPVRLSSVTTSYNPITVAINGAGNRAYLATNDAILEVYDVSGAPVRLSSVTTSYNPITVAINGAGNRAYLATNDAILEVYDVSGAPVRLGNPYVYDPTANNQPTQLAVNRAGTRVYLGVIGTSSGVSAFDVSGNGTPVALGNTVATDGHPIDVAVNGAGTRAYAVSFNNTLATFDLSNSGVPALLGSPVSTSGRPGSLALNGAGTRAYVTAGGSLQVFSLGAAAPTVVGILGNHTATQNLDLAGYQLVSSGSTGLVLSSAGNVGIGTTSAPSQKLEVVGNVKITGSGNGLTFADGSVQTSASSVINLVGDVTSSGTTTSYNNVVPAAKGGAGAVNGLLKANGSGQVSAAVAGTDYAAVTGSPAYIQNGTNQQANSNFNVSGVGTVGGLLTAGSATLGSATGAVVLPGLSTAGFVTNSASGQLGTATAASLGTSFVLNQSSPQANAAFNIAGNGTVGGQLTASSASVGGNAVVAGTLGVGTTAVAPATQALDVRGNVRLGADGGSSATGTGQTIEWVGPGVNTDPVGFYRFNPAADASELRVVVGDAADANDKFVVGRTSASTEGGIPGGTFTPNFTVRSDGNVGVGTTTPGQKLEVAGQVFSSGSTGGFRFPDNTVQTTAFSTSSLGNNFIQNQSTLQNSANFNISGSGIIGGNGVIGGNLGFGTTSPVGQLANTSANVLASDGNGISLQGLGWVNATAQGYAGVFYNDRDAGNGNGLAVKVRNASALALDVSQAANAGTTGTSLLRVQGNGNVGIGTGTDPATQKLDVRGNVRLGTDGGNTATGTGQTIEFVGPGFNTDPVGLYRTNPNSDQSELRVVVGNNADANDKFVVGRSTASAEGNIPTGTFTPSLTVQGNGNVGIGLSNAIGGLHIDRPEVGGLSGSLQATALGVVLSGGSSGSPSIELRGDSKTPYIDFAEAANQDYTTRLISQGGVLNVYGVNGGVLLNVRGGLQATSVTQTSDARFKTNVRPLGGALASVLALRGVRYEWNALGIKHGGTAGAPQVGFLAQELEKVYPELVSTDKDGYKAVNYAQLTPVLLEAIKELAARNEALEASNTALQTRATTAEAKATATTEAFEARLRRLEAASAGQAQR